MKSKIDEDDSGNLPVIVYDDGLLRLIAAGLAAFAICGYGFSGSMLERMTHVPFYIVFGFSFGIAWGLLTVIRFFTIRFDIHYHWTEQFIKRFIMQFLACWLLPMAIVFFLSILFFAAIGSEILQTNYLHEDFLLTGLLLAICNILYVLAFFVSGNRYWRDEVSKGQNRADELEMELERVHHDLQNAIEDLAKLATDRAREDIAGTPYIISTSKAKTRYLYSDIAYFYMENGTVLVQLMNEEAPLPANENSLVTVEQNSNYFFRSVTRQYVVALHAIEECRERGDGGLLITLKPHHFMLEVPKRRGQELESWILENVSIEKE